MAEQVVDVRAAFAALRRQRGAIALVGLLGAALGVGLPVLRPPMYTSTTEVLLPTPAITTSQSNPTDSDTQVQIASSQTVLGPAGKAVKPALDFRELSRRIAVTAPSEQTLLFTASAPTAAAAEALASAAATSEVAYVAQAATIGRNGNLVDLLHRLEADLSLTRSAVNSAKDSPATVSLGGQLATLTGQLQTLLTSAEPTPGTATIVQPASVAVRPGPVRTYVLPAVIGLVAGLLLAALVTLFAARLDRRVRTRDHFAEVVGSPVVTSFDGPSAHSIGAWHHLVADYDADPVEAWALRQLLRQLPAQGAERRSVRVVSLENDVKAAGLGPLLASYAAASGVETELVLGEVPHSLSMGTALRRVAGTELRPGLHVSDGTARRTDAKLTVSVSVVDAAHSDQVAAVLDRVDSPVLLSATSGAATAKQLARAAIAADSFGRVAGVVVVDPDPTDRTSGGILGRGDARHDLPTRLAGLETASAKGGRR